MNFMIIRVRCVVKRVINGLFIYGVIYEDTLNFIA